MYPCYRPNFSSPGKQNSPCIPLKPWGSLICHCKSGLLYPAYIAMLFLSYGCSGANHLLSCILTQKTAQQHRSSMLCGRDMGFVHTSQMLPIPCTVQLAHPESTKEDSTLSAGRDTSGYMTKLPLCRSKHSMSEHQGGSNVSRKDPGALLRWVLEHCGNPSNPEQSSCLTASKQHWTEQKGLSHGNLGVKLASN